MTSCSWIWMLHVRQWTIKYPILYTGLSTVDPRKYVHRPSFIVLYCFLRLADFTYIIQGMFTGILPIYRNLVSVPVKQVRLIWDSSSHESTGIYNVITAI